MMLMLRGFTPYTLRWLAEQEGVHRITSDSYGCSGREAMHLLNELRETDDSLFPGGKWATIQHLEGLIAQAIDEAAEELLF